MDEPTRYESAKRIVSVIGFVLDLLILIYLLSSRTSIQIRQFAEARVSSTAGIVAIYTITIGAIFKLFDLPLSFYSAYVLEHRFGLSRQSVGGWIKDQLKAVALGTVLGVAGAEVVYLLLRTHPYYWWVLASVVFIAFVVVMTNLAPVLLLP